MYCRSVQCCPHSRRATERDHRQTRLVCQFATTLSLETDCNPITIAINAWIKFQLTLQFSPFISQVLWRHNIRDTRSVSSKTHASTINALAVDCLFLSVSSFLNKWLRNKSHNSLQSYIRKTTSIIHLFSDSIDFMPNILCLLSKSNSFDCKFEIKFLLLRKK